MLGLPEEIDFPWELECKSIPYFLSKTEHCPPKQNTVLPSRMFFGCLWSHACFVLMHFMLRFTEVEAGSKRGSLRMCLKPYFKLDLGENCAFLGESSVGCVYAKSWCSSLTPMRGTKPKVFDTLCSWSCPLTQDNSSWAGAGARKAFWGMCA